MIIIERSCDSSIENTNKLNSITPANSCFQASIDRLLLMTYSKSMSNITYSLKSLLKSFNVSSDETHVYLLLTKEGDVSALQISRKLRLGRTKVYRLLDKLKEKGLVTQKMGDTGSLFEASSPNVLNHLLTQREQELKSLKTSLPDIISGLEVLGKRAEVEGSCVRHYSGVKGLQQVTYHSLAAKGELLTMELSTMDAFFGEDEAEDLRAELLKNKTHIRTLSNLIDIPDWTNHTKMVKKYWDIRHIPKKELNIKFEVLIYNNIYAMYKYVGSDVFCVEINSPELAAMQRQVFEYLWSNATPFVIVSNHGAAKLPSY